MKTFYLVEIFPSCLHFSPFIFCNNRCKLMKTGIVIKARREELGLSIKDIARLAGISENYLKRIERGQKKAGVNALAKIAKTLNISIEELAKENC